jgi:hypothetical protein
MGAAFDAFLGAVFPELVADPEGLQLPAVQVVNDDCRRSRGHGAHFQAPAGVDVQVLGALVEHFADEVGGFGEDRLILASM